MYTSYMEANIYFKRRQTLGENFSRTLFIIPAGGLRPRSHSVFHRFKSPSDWNYLVGVDIPEGVLLLLGRESYLWISSSTQDIMWKENFVIRSINENLQNVTIVKAYSILDLVLDLEKKCDRIASPVGRDPFIDQLLLQIISYSKSQRRSISLPVALCDSRLLVGQLRLHKSALEQQIMKEAALRSSKVHREIMQEKIIGKTEIQIANQIESGFFTQDLAWTAYETIIGSGARAMTLHADPTDKIIAQDELVLIDAGGEWQGYCADITRTYPSGKRFSKEQALIYQTVLNAQKHALANAKVGVTLAHLDRLTKEKLFEDLKSADNYFANMNFLELQNLMPHSTSHWLGLDVHDPCPYVDDAGNAILLQEGMTFTVEPGLYFRQPGKYHGIGVRIEDDICVCKNGAEILSDVPKEIEEIEELRPDNA